MTNKSLIILLEIVIIALLVTVMLVALRSCSQPKPRVREVVTVDTLVVTNTITNTVYRDRIKARIDTLYIASGEPIGYEASIDTTQVLPKCRIKTQITFKHPEQVFSLKQTASVDIDTVFITKERLITQTKIKTNWNSTAIGSALGFVAGIITAIAIQK